MLKSRKYLFENYDINVTKQILLTEVAKNYNWYSCEAIKYLVKEKHYDVNRPDKDGYPPLHYVSDLKTAQTLIKLGAQINYEKNIDLMYDLVLKKGFEYYKLLMYFIDQGMKSSSDPGYNKLFRLILNNYDYDCENKLKILKFLIFKGANINYISDNKTVLDMINISDKIEIIKFILSQNNLDVKNEKNITWFKQLKDSSNKELRSIYAEYKDKFNLK